MTNSSRALRPSARSVGEPGNGGIPDVGGSCAGKADRDAVGGRDQVRIGRHECCVVDDVGDSLPHREIGAAGGNPEYGIVEQTFGVGAVMGETARVVHQQIEVEGRPHGVGAGDAGPITAGRAPVLAGLPVLVGEVGAGALERKAALPQGRCEDSQRGLVAGFLSVKQRLGRNHLRYRRRDAEACGAGMAAYAVNTRSVGKLGFEQVRRFQLAFTGPLHVAADAGAESGCLESHSDFLVGVKVRIIVVQGRELIAADTEYGGAGGQVMGVDETLGGVIDEA